MSAYTPGPWAQEWHEAHVAGCTRPVLQARIVAGPRNMTVVACPFGNGEENWKANARLIAAAPDLLAALERAERLFCEALPKFNWGASALDANAIRLLNEVPGEVAAAIAKARGAR